MLPYEEWVKVEAAKIKSDGCTFVSELYHWCCLQHDLCYYYGRDPFQAYRVGWQASAKIDREWADKLFLACNIKKSKLGRFSPEAWVRYAGVRAGGWKPWNEHRRLRP
jgi:hypothetical protein